MNIQAGRLASVVGWGRLKSLANSGMHSPGDGWDNSRRGLQGLGDRKQMGGVQKGPIGKEEERVCMSVEELTVEINERRTEELVKGVTGEVSGRGKEEFVEGKQRC